VRTLELSVPSHPLSFAVRVVALLAIGIVGARGPRRSDRRRERRETDAQETKPHG